MADLSEAREAAGLTRKELAECAKVSTRAIASYENKDRRPSTDVAKRIAQRLGLTLEQMWSMFYATDDQETA